MSSAALSGFAEGRPGWNRHVLEKQNENCTLRSETGAYTLCNMPLNLLPPLRHVAADKQNPGSCQHQRVQAEQQQKQQAVAAGSTGSSSPTTTRPGRPPQTSCTTPTTLTLLFVREPEKKATYIKHKFCFSSTRRACRRPSSTLLSVVSSRGQPPWSTQHTQVEFGLFCNRAQALCSPRQRKQTDLL